MFILTMTSKEYGTEIFDYDTRAEAEAARGRIERRVEFDSDNVVRSFSIIDVNARLEYIRGELFAERISYDELCELESLSKYIDDGDVELLEAAGVEETPHYSKGRLALDHFMKQQMENLRGCLHVCYATADLPMFCAQCGKVVK